MLVIQISAHPYQHQNQCVSDFLLKWFLGQTEGENPIARGLKHGIQPSVHLTKEDLTSLVRKGLIFLNQKKVPHLPFLLKGKCKILIALPEDLTKKPQYKITQKNIVFEDDNIVILNKPSGLPSQSTLNIFDDHALSGLMAYYIQKNKGLKAPYLNLMHRLDKDTSGLLLFSKKIAVNKSLTELFEKRKINKSYLAITDLPSNNIDSKTFKVTGLIKKTPQPNMPFYFSLDPNEGLYSETLFEILKENEKYVLIKCIPKTGRSHQIRVHLKSQNLPIVGDSFYNPKSKASRLMLHAWKLSFIHPITKKQLEIEASVPEDFYLKP